MPVEVDIGNIVEWRRAVFFLKNKRSEALEEVYKYSKLIVILLF